MKTYSEKLKSPRWQAKRLSIMQRDGFACRDCSAEDKTLHVHHCHYEKGEPWEIDEQFLLTLCEKCHKRRGELERKGKRALALIFSKLDCPPDDNYPVGLVGLIWDLEEMAEKKNPTPVLTTMGDLIRVGEYRAHFEAALKELSPERHAEVVAFVKDIHGA